MGVVRAYPSLMLARQAAEWLVQHGIAARSVGENDAFGGVGPISGSYPIMVDESCEPAATQLLDEWDRLPPLSPADWERQTVPDLALLAPGTPAPCPSCGRQLPLDAAVSRCPACRAAVSVVDVLMSLYGPDVFQWCYPDSSEPMAPEVLDTLDFLCPGCRYPLRGLPLAGYCPECGRPYSKQAILRAESGLE